MIITYQKSRKLFFSVLEQKGNIWKIKKFVNFIFRFTFVFIEASASKLFIKNWFMPEFFHQINKVYTE